MITSVLITNFRFTRPDEVRCVVNANSASNDYRGDLGEVFRVAVVLPGEINNIFVVASTAQNADCLSIFEFLDRFSYILEVYLEGKFDQKHIEARLPLIYELVEEMIDYGYPQVTDIESVDKFITQGKITEAMITNAKQRKQKKIAGRTLAPEQITESATGMTPWRAPGIVYKRNELWIDVIENIHLLVSPSGSVLRAYIDGKIQLKCQLSGQPQCEFGMNDKLLVEKEKASGKPATKDELRGNTQLTSLDDMSFHQCVRLPRFEADRTVSFVPPDGTFTLMTYRTSQHVNIPFKIISHVKQNSDDKMDYEVSIISEFEASKSGQKVVVKIPTPPNTALCHIVVKGVGKAVYKAEEGGIIWRIKKFPGKVEASLRATVELLSTTATTTTTTTNTPKQIWDRPPITMQFTVHTYAASGLRIRYLKVSEKSGYHPYKWVRYLTQAGDYEKRI